MDGLAAGQLAHGMLQLHWDGLAPTSVDIISTSDGCRAALLLLPHACRACVLQLGVDAAPQKVLASLISFDTADAFNISLGNVEVTGETENAGYGLDILTHRACLRCKRCQKQRPVVSRSKRASWRFNC